MVISAALVALTATAHADECVPSTYVEEDMVDGAGVIYVANDIEDCGQFCFVSIWIFQESNGIAGLQRNDEMVDNTCGGTIPSDTLLF